MNALLNRRGLSLVEFSIVTAISVIAIAVLASVSDMLSRIDIGTRTDSSMLEIRSDILRSVNDDLALQATIKSPANAAAFSCINGSGCLNQPPQNIYLYDSNGNQIPAVTLPTGADATKGITPNGVPCNGFGASVCNYKFVATWTPVCPPPINILGAASADTNCQSPMIKIDVQLQQKGTSANPFHSSEFNISVVRSQALGQSASSATNQAQNDCNLIDGAVYDPKSGLCVAGTTVNWANKACPTCGAGTPGYITGWNADMSLKCTCAVSPDSSFAGDGYTCPIEPSTGLPIPGRCCPVAHRTVTLPDGVTQFSFDVQQVLLGVSANGTLSCGPGEFDVYSPANPAYWTYFISQPTPSYTGT